jgi:hypothetical protein
MMLFEIMLRYTKSRLTTENSGVAVDAGKTSLGREGSQWISVREQCRCSAVRDLVSRACGMSRTVSALASDVVGVSGVLDKEKAAEV